MSTCKVLNVHASCVCNHVADALKFSNGIEVKQAMMSLSDEVNLEVNSMSQPNLEMPTLLPLQAAVVANTAVPAMLNLSANVLTCFIPKLARILGHVCLVRGLHLLFVLSVNVIIQLHTG